MITGLTMGACNVLVLKETLISMSTVCDEIVYGDMLLWESDREILKSYQKEFNLKIVTLKFDYIFRNGFSSLLNELAKNATNSMVMYLNTSEIIDIDYGILEAIKDNPECNAFYFMHPSENHRWFRTYNRHELEWSGVLHEQLKGEYKPYHKPIFQMRDLPKDMNDPYKANVADSFKEILYFSLYMRIVNEPATLGETDAGWVKFASENYASFRSRLIKKGDFYVAVVRGDYEALIDCINRKPHLFEEKYKSSVAIEYQNDNAFLGKTNQQ